MKYAFQILSVLFLFIFYAENETHVSISIITKKNKEFCTNLAKENLQSPKEQNWNIERKIISRLIETCASDIVEKVERKSQFRQTPELKDYKNRVLIHFN